MGPLFLLLRYPESVKFEKNRTMIGSENIIENVSRNNALPQRFRNEEIVYTPPDVSFTGLHAVRPP